MNILAKLLLAAALLAGPSAIADEEKSASSLRRGVAAAPAKTSASADNESLPPWLNDDTDRELKNNNNNNNNNNSNNNNRNADGLCIRGQKCQSSSGVIERFPCTPRAEVANMALLTQCESSCGGSNCCRVYNEAMCSNEYTYNRCVCSTNTIPLNEWAPSTSQTLAPTTPTTRATTSTTTPFYDEAINGTTTTTTTGPTRTFTTRPATTTGATSTTNALVLGTCSNPTWVNKGFGYAPTDPTVLASLSAFGLQPGSCMEASHCNSARGNCCNKGYCVCTDPGSNRNTCL